MTSRERETRRPDETAPAGRSAEAARIREPDKEAAPAPMQTRADDAGETAGKDAVQIGSEESFPASDPPSWMSVAHPGGRDDPESARPGPVAAARDQDRPHVPVEPPRAPRVER